MINMTLLDILSSFFTVVTSILTGAAVGFVIVSYIVYDKDADKEDETDDEYEGEEKYQFQFFNELENLPEREMTKEELEELRLKTVEEETPEGKIIMTYNSDTESFWYYADSTTVPYSTLDTVARVFSIKYNCKSICVNYREEWLKGKKNAVNEKEKREKEKNKPKEPKEKSIFANFKSYNKKHGGDDVKKVYYIITEKSNKFKYKGKLYELIKNTDENSSLHKIDYSTFKKLYSEKTIQ